MVNLNKLNKNLICIDKIVSNNTPTIYSQKRESLLAYSKNYYKENKEERKAYARNRAKEKRKELCVKKTLRKTKIKRATPSWVSIEELKTVYRNRPANHEVDHIIPIINKLICGLNVPWNLQYLSKEDNAIKSNSFDGTKKNNGWKTKKGPQP